MPTPDFLILGAPKCGTTALWHYLDAHPEVTMASVKEPRFFTRQGGGLARGEVNDQMPRAGTYDRGSEWYDGLFAHAAPGSSRGEASTVYCVAPDAPDLIHSNAPDVRLVLMVRDPVDRMYSHYWQERKAGWDPGPFADLVASGHPRARYYEAASHYADTVERYLAHFGRDQLLVVAKEDLDADPASALTRIQRHIGVDPTFRPPTLGRRFNVQRVPRFPALRRLGEWARATVGARLPDAVRQPLGRAQRAVERGLSTELDYEPLHPSLRAELLPRFEADVELVEVWTGRPRPAWRTADEPAEATES
ncbi:sulfotransferase family protein [Rubrivirga marina]|uniref:Sulfotransferase domain-containing protein n=1 Tax=Rubrivirga marina TaxID=1196024 RepID=A0A271J2G5_9BACT|nr:sulfotransferase [Rubrivirga marina]PAP77155.1 hypothetical protein BSZ37_12305 [Rubrivirga marina]